MSCRSGLARGRTLHLSSIPIAIVLALSARSALAAPSFGSPVAYGTGGYAYAVAVADVNEDGAPDLIVGNLYTTQVSLLLGMGDGTFQAARAIDTIVEPGAIAAGDLDGDGHVDLVVTGASADAVIVLLGKGDGTFGPPTDGAVNAIALDEAPRIGRRGSTSCACAGSGWS